MRYPDPFPHIYSFKLSNPLPPIYLFKLSRPITSNLIIRSAQDNKKQSIKPRIKQQSSVINKLYQNYCKIVYSNKDIMYVEPFLTYPCNQPVSK